MWFFSVTCSKLEDEIIHLWQSLSTKSNELVDHTVFWQINITEVHALLELENFSKVIQDQVFWWVNIHLEGDNVLQKPAHLILAKGLELSFLNEGYMPLCDIQLVINLHFEDNAV